MFRYVAPNPYNETGFFAMLKKLLSSFNPSNESPSSEKIGTLILPAHTLAPRDTTEREYKELEKEFDVTVNKGVVVTHDGANLETVEINPNTKSQNQRYIIKFNGNYMQIADRLDDFSKEANNLDATIIAFNYRGVGLSDSVAKSIKQLKTDGIAQVQRLLDHGIPAKNIILDGLSLGGAIATLVTKHLHDHKQKVNLFNDRSLANITDTAIDILKGKSETLASTAKPFVSSTLYISNWEAEAAIAYKQIPVENKAYMFVEKFNEKNQTGGDGVIPHTASLHKGVKGNSTQGENHKMTTTTKNKGHVVPRSWLADKKHPEKSGDDVFAEFVKSRKI